MTSTSVWCWHCSFIPNAASVQFSCSELNLSLALIKLAQLIKHLLLQQELSCSATPQATANARVTERLRISIYPPPPAVLFLLLVWLRLQAASVCSTLLVRVTVYWVWLLETVQFTEGSHGYEPMSLLLCFVFCHIDHQTGVGSARLATDVCLSRIVRWESMWAYSFGTFLCTQHMNTGGSQIAVSINAFLLTCTCSLCVFHSAWLYAVCHTPEPTMLVSDQSWTAARHFKTNIHAYSLVCCRHSGA